MPISSPSGAGLRKFISRAYPSCGLFGSSPAECFISQSRVYPSPAAVLFSNMSEKSLLSLQSLPAELEYLISFGSPAGVFHHFCILHIVIIASSKCIAFPFNMEHYAIEKFKHMHSCVRNPSDRIPGRGGFSSNICTTRLLQLFLTDSIQG